MKLCYIDGKFVNPAEASLPLSDLIIQRGVGVFETISTYKKRPLMLTHHLQRLLSSAASSLMRPPLSTEAMAAIIKDGISRLDDELLIRAFLSGGDAFDRSEGVFPQPRFFVIFDPLDLPPASAYNNGVILEPIDEARLNPSVKSVDYRRSYARQKDAFEVLYCPAGEITESAHSSFFMVLNGTLITAPLTRVLKGTTRQAVIEVALKAGIKVEERCPRIEELAEAEEAFITGSVKKILPVVKIGSKTIGTGRPGALTGRLSELYLGQLEQWLE